MMSDEIDIEEHNLLENPILKDIFPDLSILKQEINTFDEILDVQPDTPTVNKNNDETLHPTFASHSNQFDYHIKVEENEEVKNNEETVKNIKKSVKNNKEHKSSLMETSDKDFLTVCFNQAPVLSVNGSKLILGSKSKNSERSTIENMHTKVIPCNITLDDVSPYLKRCKRFCLKCMILFPKDSEFDGHHSNYHKSHEEICNESINTNSTQPRKKFKADTGKNNETKIPSTDKQELQNFKSFFKETDCSNKNIINKQKKNINIENNTEKKSEHPETSKTVKTKILIVKSLKLDDAVLEKQGLYDKCNAKSIVKTKKESLYDESNTKSIVKNKEQNQYDQSNVKSIGKNKEKVTPTIQKINRSKKERSINTSKKVLPNSNRSVTSEKSETACVDPNTLKNQKLHNRVEKKNKNRNQNKTIKIDNNKPKIIEKIDRFCTHCNNSFPSHDLYVNHLYEILLNKTKNENNDKALVKHNNEANVKNSPDNDRNIVKQNIVKEQLVLKSVLYKCRKCDVHFIFVKTAMNHVQHMDMLMNWKCPTCLRIFKIEDKKMHILQHREDNDIKVYDLCDAEFSRVLYNCPKCAIHFLEDNFIAHYFSCGEETPHSRYCNTCDILVDKDTMLSHVEQHKNNKLSIVDFTVVVTDIINGMKAKDVPTSKNNRLPGLKMSFCEKCKCFFTKHKNHNSETCVAKKKYICKLCGLLISGDSMAAHGKLHSIHGNLKLCNFTFFDFQNGNQIVPPIPQFPFCDVCHIHFASKTASSRHVCGENMYSLCRVCDKKFTPIAFRLHSPFHSYSTSVAGPDSEIKSKQRSDNEVQKYSSPKSETIIKQIMTAKLVVSIPRLKLSTVKSKSASKKVFRKKSIVSIPKLDIPAEDQYVEVSEGNAKAIIFNCNSCDLVFDNYDRVVEHCQMHYEDKNTWFSGIKCTTCDLVFETKCYNEHIKNHANFNCEKYCVKVSFDLDYFIQENIIWTEHIFKGTPKKSRKDILDKSIYKFEVRIKMTVVQEGPVELTVYQCDRCGCCLDTNLYNHTKNSCFNLRKHPCVKCDLPFASYLSKLEHEKIHQTRDVQTKDYRLVKFNRETDKRGNENVITALIKKYVLYQCRNCNGIINIYKFNSHVCEVSNLQNCSACGLLIYTQDFGLHSEKHKVCNKYSQKNMKIVLCGQKMESLQNGLLPSYTGFVCDYTFYKCAQCEVCVKDFQCAKHVCTEFKIKCSLCDLYFLSNFHRKLHEQDPDFRKENISIITFNLVKIEDKTIKTQKRPSSETSLPVISVEIYKCPICPLNFSDKDSISTHMKSCNPKQKVSRQTCSKCGLMFTSQTLFNHLIKYHGSDRIDYKFNVKDINSVEVTFKCYKCILHFTTFYQAFKHSTECSNLLDGDKCTICDLTFAPACKEDHESNHLKKYKDSKIVTVKPASSIAMEEIMTKFDANLSKRVDLSKDVLSKMNVSGYSSVLYKCTTCNIYLIDSISIFAHFINDAHNSIIRDNCKICELDFLLADLTSHVFVHHIKWGLQLNDFIVIESSDLF